MKFRITKNHTSKPQLVFVNMQICEGQSFREVRFNSRSPSEQSPRL
jgi:hypothetical protein